MIKSNIKMFIMLISILLLCNVKPYAADNENKLTVEKINSIEKYTEEYITKGKIPGLSLVIINGNDTVYKKGFGYADIDKKTKVTSETEFQIGSNSKAFTALGILKLQEEGKLSLDDSVNKYLPWLSLKYKGKDVEVTLKEFMHHTSGVPYNTIAALPKGDDSQALHRTVETLNNIELNREPGSKFEYATINYDVLGLVIESVTEKPFEEYERSVLDELGLKHTYLFESDIEEDNLAKGYKMYFGSEHEYNAPDYRGNKPAGYFIMNGDDLSRWIKIQLNLEDECNFNRALINESHEPDKTVNKTDYGSYYAAGWEIYEDNDMEISHRGINHNFSSSIILRKNDGIGIGILCNTNSSYCNQIAYGIRDIMLGNEPSEFVRYDMNILSDKVAMILIGISLILSILIIYLACKNILYIKNYVKNINRKIALYIVVLAAVMGAVDYLIYKIPSISSNVNWNFIFEWAPDSIKISAAITFTALHLIYLYLLTLFINRCSICKNKQNVS